MLGHRGDPELRERDDEALIHDAARVRQGPALLVGTLLGVLVVIAAVIAVVQNEDSVRFEWTVLDVDAPLWLLLLVTLAAGAALWALGGAAVRRALHRAGRRHDAVEELERRRGGGHTTRTFS